MGLKKQGFYNLKIDMARHFLYNAFITNLEEELLWNLKNV